MQCCSAIKLYDDDEENIIIIMSHHFYCIRYPRNVNYFKVLGLMESHQITSKDVKVLEMS